jgi:hypothetical protein
MSTNNSLRRWTLSLSLLVLLACPAWAADSVIFNGIDVWTTPADGRTFVDFSFDPIPRGFFCNGSEAFIDSVPLKGKPIAMSPPGTLPGIDTIVQRLDDARFNKRGVAHTRLQIQALSLVSIEPINTGCGQYEVGVSLTGQQPITRMTIVREHSQGGRFVAPVGLRTRVTFRPLEGASGETLEVVRKVSFANHTGASWANRPGDPSRVYAGFVAIDTNDDGVPDTNVPGTSNFAAGWRVKPDLSDSGGILTKAESINIIKDITEHCCSGMCHI